MSPTLAAGTKLGPYEILAPLGAGGMGEVYRARDTRLGRDVAVKVLPMEMSASPEVRARFEREAKTIGSLNHPNICVLFDVGREGDVDYLVMELVEGETLAARIKRGPLAPAEYLRVGTQIADALDRAHRAGVIHRDLKPANIMLTRSGAKLMDFGLSRAAGLAGPDGGSGLTMGGLSQSPTIAPALTTAGTLLGTFQYMSPEQLEGGVADARSDIWGLGCVLYEMVTGRRAFEGRSQASLIAAILEREPVFTGDASSGSGSTAVGGAPFGIERLIRNCLAKDPEERIQTAHDVRLQLQGIAEGAGLSATSVAAPPPVVAPAVGARAGGSRLAWAIAVLALLTAGGIFAWLYPRTRVAPAPGVRFRVADVPGARGMVWPRISPDGMFLAFVVTDSAGTPSAFVRPLNQMEAHPVAGTERLRRAYWSPDGREIAFVADEKIQRVPIGGGSPTVICAAPGGYDLSWGSKGLILMDGQNTDSLRVVPAGGGELRPASTVDRAANEVGSAWPFFLPDGEHFLFIGNLPNVSSGGNIRLGKIGSLESRLLGRSDGRVEYAPGGWMLFVRGSTLLAQKLDVGAGKLTGQPITLVDDLLIGNADGNFSISQTGTLAFSRKQGGDDMFLRAADRGGEFIGDPLTTGTLGNPVPSPDGGRLLYQRGSPGGASGDEIHVLDLGRSTDTRLTFTDGRAATAVWSPDGRRFAFATRTDAGLTRLRIGSADGLGAPDSIAIPDGLGASLTQWMAVGSRLVFTSGGFRVFDVPTDGVHRDPEPLTDSTMVMSQPRVSPDGRWLAGVIGIFPNTNIFVQSLAGPPGRWQISSTPAVHPVWTKSGRELLYESREGPLMAVDIDTKEGFRAGTPHALFRPPIASFRFDLMSWGCDENGERFYLVVPSRARSAGIIEVATDFQAMVNRR